MEIDNKIIESLKINNIKDKLIELTKPLLNHTFNTKNLQQRGIADKIEYMFCETITTLSGDGLVVEQATSKRSMEDIQVVINGKTTKIDIKSHSLGSTFSMPNLVSVDRLRKFYSDSNNSLVYLFIDYSVEGDTTTIKNIEIKLVEELSWEMLAIQNLGKGQLQIKDMNSDLIFIDADREVWLNTLSEKTKSYYDKLIKKIEGYKKTW
jgi:hypothetical protein